MNQDLRPTNQGANMAFCDGEEDRGVKEVGDHMRTASNIVTLVTFIFKPAVPKKQEVNEKKYTSLIWVPSFGTLSQGNDMVGYKVLVLHCGGSLALNVLSSKVSSPEAGLEVENTWNKNNTKHY